ncbi:hypothetical protein F511_26528 [Dorcoceras hygrometricum]|uniref:Uncharacterized protein n=1 Tax=Dorcoceras hygrometricum TaxID=472368 RepID=A0A2Z7BQX6_9LAMI|nr:hypothetical protein F511_26528 [Dorcoceras hygrometricum]
MNKLARSSSREGKNRTRAAQEQIRREEENSSKKRPAQRKPERRQAGKLVKDKPVRIA